MRALLIIAFIIPIFSAPETFSYYTRAERSAIVAMQEALGKTMVHDNRTRTGGELVFDVKVESQPSARELRIQALEAKLKSKTIIYSELVELLSERM